ncbi:MAG: hypothetical protein ABI271_03525 [Nitrosospira sp.]
MEPTWLNNSHQFFILLYLHRLGFILIGLETSMRRSGILAIRRGHINFSQLTISIPKAKAGARDQPITAHLAGFLVEHVAALQPGTPWLLPRLGRKRDKP